VPEVEVGVVSDFFAHPVVAGIELIGELRVGDTIRVKGHTTELEFRVDSMEIDRREVDAAGPGESWVSKSPRGCGTGIGSIRWWLPSLEDQPVAAPGQHDQVLVCGSMEAQILGRGGRRDPLALHQLSHRLAALTP
jgi:hypothetical protein